MSDETKDWLVWAVEQAIESAGYDDHEGGDVAFVSADLLKRIAARLRAPAPSGAGMGWDARTIEHIRMELGPDRWAQVRAYFCDQYLPPAPQAGVAAVFGQWPGDETDADLTAALGPTAPTPREGEGQTKITIVADPVVPPGEARFVDPATGKVLGKITGLAPEAQP